MTSVFSGFGPVLAEQPPAWTGPVAGLTVALSLIVSGIGVAVILWGAYSAVLALITAETAAARGQLPKADAVTARLLFATYLLPGLDFVIAGSVIKALAAPDWQQATLVGGFALARALVGLSLGWGALPVAGFKEVPAVATDRAVLDLQASPHLPAEEAVTAGGNGPVEVPPGTPQGAVP
jgi:uncharacterized membrane protein